jgi:hypothetical protein
MYIVTITDNCGLTKKDTTYITSPSALVLNGNSTDDNSCNDGICSGTASVIVSGGASPYTYSWNIGGNTSSISSVCFGNTPSVTVTDFNGCTSSSNFTINCTSNGSGSCDPLTTYTQGGWGATPNGNNAGTYIANNFLSAFSKGLVIGTGTLTNTFNSSTSVQKVLPAGGTPGVLSTTSTNPSTVNSVFAGQLIAATLNVGFDYYDPNFAAPTRNLGTMYCNFAPFLGMTVDQVIAEANLAIGGKSTAHTIPDLSMALDFINRDYDNGIDDNGDLICNDPNASRGMAPSTGSANFNGSNTNTSSNFSVFPNPTNSNEVNIQFNSLNGDNAKITIYSMAGQLLLNQTYSCIKGANTVSINLGSISTSNTMVIIHLLNDGQLSQSTLAITK